MLIFPGLGAIAEENEANTALVRPAVPELPELPWSEVRQFILPLNNPPIVSPAEAYHLRADDIVLGVLLGESARAYPWYALANYHAVNDYINRKPVIVNLCEACNGGAAFLAYAGDTAIDFRTCGLKNGTWYATDFQTGSYWYPFSGEAFAGPLKGTKLERIRAYFSTWRAWVRDHPHTTVVLSSDEVRERPHAKNMHMAARSTFNRDFAERIVSQKPNPRRDLLPGYELVFGMIPSNGEKAKAFTVEGLMASDRPVQTTLGEIPVLLVAQNNYQIGAYIRKFRGEQLELRQTSEQPLLLQDQFGNVWNAWGRTESGPDHRAELPVADSYLTKWYEWIENYPDSELVKDYAQ